MTQDLIKRLDLEIDCVSPIGQCVVSVLLLQDLKLYLQGLGGEGLVEAIAKVIYEADRHQGRDAITQECASRFAQVAMKTIKERMGC